MNHFTISKLFKMEFGDINVSDTEKKTWRLRIILIIFLIIIVLLFVITIGSLVLINKCKCQCKCITGCNTNDAIPPKASEQFSERTSSDIKYANTTVSTTNTTISFVTTPTSTTSSTTTISTTTKYSPLISYLPIHARIVPRDEDEDKWRLVKVGNGAKWQYIPDLQKR
ncbi:hypothetical protein SNEBB_003186 [Seison nebaliae]|nr:hypothetical protein SNEBB_003186 [Seison nebaliae]